jgi:hypothetical protein
MIGEGRRVSRTHSMTVDATADSVFPLLCPVREYDWIDVWECRMVYSESGVAEAGCVFLTDLPDRGVETWMVSRYEPARRIEFCRVAGASRACHLGVVLEDHRDGTTTLTWSYTHTAIDEAGQRFVDAYSAERYQAEMDALEVRLTHYLREGEMWKGSGRSVR